MYVTEIDTGIRSINAVAYLRWGDGSPVCPKCGAAQGERNHYWLKTQARWKCYACRTKFTVRKGTVFEESRLELHLWLQAAFLMCSSKKGVSANQLHRTLGVTLKTAWFLAHRLREAMAEGLLNPFGQGGGAVFTVRFPLVKTPRARRPSLPPASGVRQPVAG